MATPLNEQNTTTLCSPEEWLVPGRKTIEGYLVTSRGPFKRDYGLFGNLVADAIEETKPGAVPRYADLHSIWFGWDESKEPRRQAVRPFLRYKASRPIDGLRTECYGHRVRVTCSVGKVPWDNGLGAYITRASGVCLTCGED